MTVSRAIVQCESSAEQPELVLITTDPNAKKKKNKRKRRRAAGPNKTQDDDAEDDDDDDAPVGCWALLLNAVGCYFLYSYASDWWSGEQPDPITSGASNINNMGLQGHHQIYDDNNGE